MGFGEKPFQWFSRITLTVFHSYEKTVQDFLEIFLGQCSKYV
jgi:hypothetical protein